VLDGYAGRAFHAETEAPLYQRARAVLCLNEHAAEGRGSRYIPWPDPIDDQVTACTDSPLIDAVESRAGGRPVILCPGVSHRKRTVEFLRAAQSTPTESAYFVVVGQPSDEMTQDNEWQDLTSTSMSNTIIHQERCSDAELEALFALSRSVFLCYAEHAGSSGMLTRAAVHRTRALVAPGGLMAERVRDFDLGLVARSDSPESYRDAMLALATTPANDAQSEDYCNAHSIGALRRQLEKLLLGEGERG
jgi:hypothetical protein